MASGKVLIVEDQPLLKDFFRETLERLGLEVVTALTGKIALNRAQEHHLDLILLDLMLPDMDGFEVCRALRQQPETSQTPIVFISAVSSGRHLEMAMEAGANDFIIKPLGLQDLRMVVDRYLGGNGPDESSKE